MERIAKFIYTKSRLIIVLVVILNIVALVSYQTGESISVLIEQDNSLLEKESLEKVFRLQEDIEEIDGVSQVQSFIPSEISVGSRTVQVDERFIERHSDILEDFIKQKYFLTHQFLSSDDSKGILIANLELDARAGEVVESLEEIVRNEEDWTLSLAGNEIIKDTLWDYLLRIIFILPPCAIGFLLDP